MMKAINLKTPTFLAGFPQQGEIYKIYFNPKKGEEIAKIRPALVLSNNQQNQFDNQIIVAPLTSEEREINTNRPFTVLIKPNKENGLKKPSKVLLNRIQTIDIKIRLRDYIGQVNPEIIQQSQEAICVVFNIMF